MTTIQLKNFLIYKIAGINDKSFLSAIKTIIESKSESIVYQTTPAQRKAINEGRKQISRNEYFTNEQVELEIEKWLKEK
ncbi:MAG: hypothetical protein A2046_08940 [Bacteroidetes bacterium GWA2_30_7]|nr:MAG: hypothetical protein A2046_08940 [Bacteroidetes bacterium GWA2_30_7]